MKMTSLFKAKYFFYTFLVCFTSFLSGSITLNIINDRQNISSLVLPIIFLCFITWFLKKQNIISVGQKYKNNIDDYFISLLLATVLMSSIVIWLFVIPIHKIYPNNYLALDSYTKSSKLANFSEEECLTFLDKYQIYYSEKERVFSGSKYSWKYLELCGYKAAKYNCEQKAIYILDEEFVSSKVGPNKPFNNYFLLIILASFEITFLYLPIILCISIIISLYRIKQLSTQFLTKKDLEYQLQIRGYYNPIEYYNYIIKHRFTRSIYVVPFLVLIVLIIYNIIYISLF